MLATFIKTLFKITPDVASPHTSWQKALYKHGRQAMYVLLLIQIVLVPSHIFTTDFVDPASRFSLVSIFMRVGAVLFFLCAISFVAYNDLHPSWYYSVSMFVNALSDGYMASRSGMDYLVTHMLGLGVVLVGYAVLALWSLRHYLLTMGASVLVCVLCFMFFNDFSFLEIMKEGGAFIFFFLIMSPTLCYLRYSLAKNEFNNSLKLYSQHNQIKELLKQVEDANGQLKQSFEELYQNQEEILAQRDMLSDKNTALEFYTDKINKSIATAFIVQHAILPTKAKMQQLFEEYFVLFMPKDTVSGDFYWVRQIQDKRLVFVADCTGHGVSGAFMTLIGATLLDKIVETREIEQPSVILCALHEEIRKILQQEHTQNNYGMDAGLAIIQPKEEDVEVSFAGAKRPLYYLPQGSQELMKLAGTRKTIGGFDNISTAFDDVTLYLPANSVLYLTSDGYADQHNVQRKKYSGKHLMQFIESKQKLSLLAQKSKLETEIKDYMRDTEQRDDILILGVKI